MGGPGRGGPGVGRRRRPQDLIHLNDSSGKYPEAFSLCLFPGHSPRPSLRISQKSQGAFGSLALGNI